MATTPSELRDVVYVVRPGEDNDELKFSLRSLANLPHRNVWIVGYRPSWVRDAGSIEMPALPSKWPNLHQSLTAACKCAHISEDFLLFNDDMYVVEPVAEPPVFHLGPVRELIERRRAAGLTEHNSWFRGLVETYAQMQEWGHADPLAYECHIPMPYRRSELGALLAAATRHPFLWNTAYSATTGPVGTQGPNVKVSELDQASLEAKLGTPFLSSNDKSFAQGAVGRHVRGLFPDPGLYEEGR